MDIVEFSETIYDGNLLEWQKKVLLVLDKYRREGRLPELKIRVLKNQSKDIFIYMSKETLKELTQHGKTNDSK